MRISAVALIFLAMLLITGCAEIGYYSQAVGGHLKLMSARQDVQALIESDETDHKLRERLQLATEIRRFASDELQLPDNDSYSTYVETGRSSVTWNVVAAEEFSVNAKTWCFPVAGCVSYKGFFNESAAKKYSASLDKENYDTTINGATAYSTLGWFDDPILDIMLRGSDIRIAGLIFHELAHQQLYVKGDSDFNEAYASFVEQEGVRIWLKKTGQTELLGRYADWLQRRSEFSDLLLSARKELETLYEEKISDKEKRAGKQAVFAGLRARYQVFKDRHGSFTGYDRWFEKELNNARLVATATYRRFVPAFEKLYEELGGDFNAFYQKAEALAAMDKTERQNILKSLISENNA